MSFATVKSIHAVTLAHSSKFVSPSKFSGPDHDHEPIVKVAPSQPSPYESQPVTVKSSQAHDVPSPSQTPQSSRTASPPHSLLQSTTAEPPQSPLQSLAQSPPSQLYASHAV